MIGFRREAGDFLIGGGERFLQDVVGIHRRAQIVRDLGTKELQQAVVVLKEQIAKRIPVTSHGLGDAFIHLESPTRR